MDKRFVSVLAVIAIIVVGAIWINSNKKTDTTTNTSPTNHIEGKGTTGVKLVEYGDYECPYCGQYFPIVKQVVAEYTNQITFQFRNLPLTQIHPNAFAGARAAEAADMQGKFWQMHDALYESQSEWVNSSDPTTFFYSLAQQLGLNVAKFKTDYASTEVNNKINADVAAFNKTGAEEATPSFFLDGKQIHPDETVASFTSLLNAAIKQKGFTPDPTTTSSSSSTGSSSSTSTSTAAPQSKQ